MALFADGTFTLAANSRARYATGSIMYFAQGIPQGLLAIAIPAWLASLGVSASQIASYLAVITLPWAFKLVTGPFMDRFEYLPMGRRYVYRPHTGSRARSTQRFHEFRQGRWLGYYRGSIRRIGHHLGISHYGNYRGRRLQHSVVANTLCSRAQWCASSTHSSDTFGMKPAVPVMARTWMPANCWIFRR